MAPGKDNMALGSTVQGEITWPQGKITSVLIVTVSHRTFSGQFRHLSGQFFPLSDQINTSSYVCMYIGNAVCPNIFSGLL